MAKDYATFVEAVGAFMDQADWLGESEGPACTSLMKAAEVLDKRVTATMLAEYGKVFRYLRNLKPDESGVVSDPLMKYMDDDD